MSIELSANLPFWLREESFWMPATLIESAWHQNAPAAFWITGELAPRTVVELGVHNGFSYLCFCQAIDRLGLSSRCFGVDTWEGDEHSGFYGEEVLAELRAVHDPLYGRFSRLVQSTFDDAVGQFHDGSIDLLHLDGRHFEEDVAHDFETWKPKLSDRAVALFHDINVRERGFGVYRFWENLTRQYPTFSFFDEHGLGVALIGHNVPQSLARLADLDEESTRLVRRAYQRLGRTIGAEWQLNALAVHTDQLGARAAQLESDVAAMNDRDTKDREFRDKQASRLHEALTDNQTLRDEIETLRDEIETLRDEIAVAHQTIADAQAEHARTSSDMKELRFERERLRDALADSTTELAEAQTESTRLTNELNGIYESRSWRLASVLWRARG